MQQHKVMHEDSVHLRAVSLHLSRTLEEVGLNKLTVKRRRKTNLYRESIRSIYNQLIGQNFHVYHFGSQTEGATIHGLHSDTDELQCCNGVRIIQDLAEWEAGKVNYLMLQDDTAPGYCRLQVLCSDIPLGKQDLPNEHFTYDSSGRVILKNTVLNTPVLGLNRVRHGPARTQIGGPGFMDSDQVMAFKYNSWPRQAEEFIRRQRCHGWPSQNLLQEAVKHGVFLVPVGYKLSLTEELEWRLSASLAERCLMFSLNTVHIKCYIVLKMLMKTFVEPRVSECVSSYHCKTALLYCTETTDPGFWRDDNLLQCITNCLTLLLTWVTDIFCPQFVIPKENLFAGKVTDRNRGVLMSILTYLIESNVEALLRVHIDDIGPRLQEKINTEPSVVPVLDSFETITLAGEFEANKQRCFADFTQVLVYYKKENSVRVINMVYYGIEVLKSLIKPSDILEQRAITMWTRFLSCCLGSFLAPVALSHKKRVPQTALRLLCIGANSGCAATLKFASVLYCSGDVKRAETILQKLEEHFCRNEMQAICGCYDGQIKGSLAFSLMMHVLRGRKRRAKLFAPCLMFSDQEIHCAPPALRIELFRSFGDDMQNREPVHDDWMDLAVVDCLPYLYYLQYITYRQLRQLDQQTRALHNLDMCIKEGKDFSHLETTWNLLGQCMELEQQPDGAMACYRTSLEIRPRNNAANWHVAILCYKLIRNRIVTFNKTKKCH